MKPEEIVERLLKARDSWLTVEPGKRLLVRRPDDIDIAALASLHDHERKAEWFVARVVGWEGITEADLLGPENAGATPAEFAPELALLVLRDRLEWLGEVSRVALDAHREFKGKRDAATGN